MNYPPVSETALRGAGSTGRATNPATPRTPTQAHGSELLVPLRTTPGAWVGRRERAPWFFHYGTLRNVARRDEAAKCGKGSLGGVRLRATSGRLHHGVPSGDEGHVALPPQSVTWR